MNYVDAGYVIALLTLFLYAFGLILRRRRWERAAKVAQVGQDLGPAAGGTAAGGHAAPVATGGRP